VEGVGAETHAFASAVPPQFRRREEIDQLSVIAAGGEIEPVDETG
jgi:hypothetical protein